ncbi:MAG: PQQ-binding-like beta-propeller repeat protein [Saprospiraceae bacterium]|nr:PQQ-binding-like beta-propeller repeat protein [Saprospiraceae bacterium]MBK6567134.1 PQQ-binding-like beta-propeller repeat protein [Saprospiraceae bacterium]
MPKPDDPDPINKLVNWKWSYQTSEYSNELANDPVLYKDWVIIGYGSDYQNRNVPLLIAVDKLTGNKVWQYNHPEEKTSSCKNFKLHDKFLILRFTERLTCLSLEDRSIVWEKKLTENHSLPFAFEIYNDYFYIAEKYYDNPDDFPFNDSVTLMRYYIPTGQTEKLYGERMAINSNKHPEIFPALVYNDGTTDLVIFTRHYLDAGDFHPVDLLAIDTKTKEVVWKNEAYSPLRSAWNTPPYIFDGNVIAASDWSMYSWNAATGNLHWKTELTGLNQKAGFSFSGPFLHGNRMYAISNEGKIFCVDSETGLLIWQNVKVGNEDNGPARGPCNRPIVVDDILFVNAWSDQALVLIDTKTGSQLERHKDAKYNGRNVLYDEETKTFFVTADEMLRAFTVKK